MAAYYGYVPVVDYALKNGMDINVKDAAGPDARLVLGLGETAGHAEEAHRARRRSFGQEPAGRQHALPGRLGRRTPRSSASCSTRASRSDEKNAYGDDAARVRPASQFRRHRQAPRREGRGPQGPPRIRASRSSITPSCPGRAEGDPLSAGQRLRHRRQGPGRGDDSPAAGRGFRQHGRAPGPWP